MELDIPVYKQSWTSENDSDTEMQLHKESNVEQRIGWWSQGRVEWKTWRDVGQSIQNLFRCEGKCLRELFYLVMENNQ